MAKPTPTATPLQGTHPADTSLLFSVAAYACGLISGLFIAAFALMHH